MQLRRDPVRVLPPELISACFRGLNLKSRIAVSHVSRTWRNAALSDRSLWNAYAVPEYPKGDDWIVALRAILLRSDPAPFSLTCSADIPDTLVDLLVQNMHRMRLIHLENVRRSTVIYLMTQDAPALESFWYTWSPEPDVSITLAWSDIRAPRLRSVRLGNFLLPGNGVFSAMDSFRGRIPTGCRLAQPLASFFPALTAIHLRNITQAALDHILPLPHTLKSMTFASAYIDPLDYAAFLTGCAPATISHLVIDSVTATSIAPAVDQFARAADGPWELQLDIENDIILRTELDVVYSISYHDIVYSQAPQPDLTGALRRISALSLSLRKYEALYKSPAWDRSWPAMTRLDLVLPISRGTTLPIGKFDDPDLPLDAPVLERISIRVYAEAVDAVRALPFVAQFVRSLGCPRLAHIALLARNPQCLLDADLSCIARLAPRFSVRDMDGKTMVTVCNKNDDL